jgi:hypothetical protein
MKTTPFRIAIAAALVTIISLPLRADAPKAPDIKHVVPNDAFLAVYARHNPERDYQRAYLADAVKTFEEEHICQRVMALLTSHMPQDKLDAAKSKWQEISSAIEPIHGAALANMDEFVLAETMEMPVNQILVATRLTPNDAADFERGLTQFAELLSRWSEGKVAVNTSKVQDATITTLGLPKESPYQPAIARLNDIVIICTSEDMLRTSVQQLQNPSAASKFDDPRLKEALTHLPKPEDSLVFFDGRKLFERLGGLGAFIRGHGNNDEHASHAARFVERIFNEMGVVDYEVTVEYTEPGQNRKATFGKLIDDYQSKLLGRVLAERQPLENWQTWIPKDATAFSVSSGCNVHELFEGITKMVQEEFPGSQHAFEKFAAVQDQIGVNLDRDILQSFSGQHVSVTVPIKGSDDSVRQESVTALKCSNPDKIRELLSRGVEALNKIPAVQMQQLKLEDLTDLAGFQAIHASFLQLIGTQPVIGFRDGWLIIGSSRAAAEKVLDVHAGKAESIDGSAHFDKFGFDPHAATYEVSYHNIGAGVRHAADLIDKAAAMAPMFIGMAAGNAKPEEIQHVQEAIAILPSIAKVVRKFDFYGNNLSDTRKGPTPGTYLRDSVTEIRMPAAK